MDHHRLAVLSRDAYDHKTHGVGGVEALYTIEDDVQVLAFRGTERNKKDILRDLRGFPWKCNGIWMHSGFGKGAAKFLEGTDIHYEMFGGLPLILTGHSLGGALAVAFAALLVAEGYTPSGLVTFGAPSVGYGGALKRALSNVPQARYVNGADCVPNQPHLGTHTCKATLIGPERTFRRRWVDINDRFYDHRIDDYVLNMG